MAVETAEETERPEGDASTRTADALRRENDELRDRLAERARERRRIVDHYERLLSASDGRSDVAGTAVDVDADADTAAASDSADPSRRRGGSSVWEVVRRVVRRLR